MKTIYHITEIPLSIEVRQIHVKDKEEAKTILEKDGYTMGWFYRPKAHATWLLVPKQEYNRKHQDQQ